MKRVIGVFSTIVMIVTSFSVVSSAFEIVLPDDVFEPETSVYDPGDVNGDGEITIVDLANFSRYLAGGEVVFDGNADMNGDEEIMSNDLAALRRYLSGGQI